ncbi:Xaa-Pro aminopeptidase [Solimonas aquatica]|uniref:Xaa-Pro aminopeptidase n=1 Tax=Solimonas aquatica TaxID=489703 RepID=A0A1H9CDG0_9GAMM|nr:aminopeptidase P N-terminal domain-containing protein [Solimonas aquatica]SEP99182.1 Xaa-Pro aminopeptidase [Solimonas aquatica]
MNAPLSKEHARRRAELMRRIGRSGVAIIPAAREVIRARDTHYRFRQDADFFYLTGFTEPEAVAVLAPGRRVDGRKAEFVMFVRPRNAEREIWDGRRAGPQGARKRYGADEAYDIDEFETRLGALLAGRERVHYTLGEHGGWDAKITACVRHIREISRRGAAAPEEFVALESSLHEMRLHKSAAELKTLARACEISAEAHCIAMRKSAPGVYEWQLAAEIEYHFARHDMQPGYGSIVGTGENACILHYVENRSALKAGDLVLIDAGGELEGYTADITRSYPASGRFSAAQQAVYEVVLAANKAAIKTLKIGESVGKPHEVATRVLTEGMVELGLLKGKPADLVKAGMHRQFFMHGTGHWLGMDVHDVGRYKLEDQYRRFEDGMVMTVEPGLYIAPGSKNVPEKYWGIGIRIEDDVVVTPQGPRVLTGGVPKDVREIEKLMAASRQ